MKVLKEEKTFVIILGLLLVCLLVIAFVKKGPLSFRKVELIYDAPFLKEDVKGLDFETVNASIKVKNVEESDLINIKIYGADSNKIKAYFEEEILHIVYENEEETKDEEYILVELPPSYTKDLVLTSVKGNIEAEKFKSSYIKVNTKEGNVDIKSCKRLTLNSDSGNVNVGSISKKIVLKTISGNVNIDKLSLSVDSKIKTESGNITIKKASDLYFSVSSKTGVVKTSKNGNKKDNKLVITTESGNVTINKG